ncbi:MAG TPA: ATP-dependent sacrificial sulfur transferase LarE [Vicinamibacterales bacterium]
MSLEAVGASQGAAPGQAPTAWASLPSAALRDKAEQLDSFLDACRSVIVAFSGGVDSALVAVVATRRLGGAALCVTAESPSYPQHHRQLARRVAADFGLRHEFVATAELTRPEYRANPVNRCYFCKTELYTTLAALASARGVAAVVDGSNADDRGDYRPGREAARERGVRSPLDEVGLTKVEVRALAYHLGMATWDEPSSACLSSRVPYHTEITDEALRTIEQAEDALRDLGFRVCRVRHHGALARLELGADELTRAVEPAWRDRIVDAVRRAGYTHVTVDLLGYRMGSLNEGIRLRSV